MSPIVPIATLVATVVPLVVPVAVAVWTWYDADARGSSAPLVWAVFAPLSGVLLAYYLLWWRRKRERDRPRSVGERRAAVAALGSAGGVVASAVAAPPDPFAQLLALPVAVAVCLLVARWVVDRSDRSEPTAAG